MVAVFPLGKLLYLGVKQMSRPISRVIQQRAVNSRFIRTYICAPPAQLLHRLEVFVKMRLMGVKGHTEVKRLSEEQAVKQGTDIIGEMVIYGIASSAIIFEYYRSSRKGQQIEDTQDDKIAKLNERLNKLDTELCNMREQINISEQKKTLEQKKN